MAKIVIPDGLMDAVGQAIDEARGGRNSMTDLPACCVKEISVEATLRWLSENPTTPTLKQMCEVETAAAHEPINSTRWLSDILMEWQRRMFFAPEPEVESDEQVREKLADLLRPEVGVYTSMIEAYRRGKASR
jgi:hypothetical protein